MRHNGFMTTIFEKAHLSRDARYLVNRADRARDRMALGAVSTMAMVGLSAHGLVGEGLPAVSAAAAVISCLGAGMAGVSGFLSARRLDKSVLGLAAASGQEAPVSRSLTGLLEAGEVFRVVREADKVIPDMVSAVAGRRARGWDASLEKGYQPPVRVRP